MTIADQLDEHRNLLARLNAAEEECKRLRTERDEARRVAVDAAGDGRSLYEDDRDAIDRWRKELGNG